MENSMFDFTLARTHMVDSQIRPNGVTDSRIIDSMARVMREDFVPEAQRAIAYMDGDVPLNGASTQRYLIEPMAFAKMLQLAELKVTDKVLEIGAATGYGAAVLSVLASHVVAVEQDVYLVEMARANLNDKVNVSLIENTLSDGHAAGAPYDLILISGAVEIVPNNLFSQLSERGRLIAVMLTNGVGKCCVWVKNGNSYTQRFAFDLSIATLPSFGKPSTGFAF
jgi:protein-L-isoaspartate(D-aspartate) O-methyltransferase